MWDVASDTDRHLDITFGFAYMYLKAHPLFPYFLKRLAITTSLSFFRLLVNGFCVTS